MGGGAESFTDFTGGGTVLVTLASQVLVHRYRPHCRRGRGAWTTDLARFCQCLTVLPDFWSSPIVRQLPRPPQSRLLAPTPSCSPNPSISHRSGHAGVRMNRFCHAITALANFPLRQLPSLPNLPRARPWARRRTKRSLLRPSSRLLCQVLVTKSSMKLGHPRHLTMRYPEPSLLPPSRLSGKTKKRYALPDRPLSHPNRYPASVHATAPPSSRARG
jgi:hypothetical protein